MKEVAPGIPENRVAETIDTVHIGSEVNTHLQQWILKLITDESDNGVGKGSDAPHHLRASNGKQIGRAIESISLRGYIRLQAANDPVKGYA
jgi:hypothetical protein